MVDHVGVRDFERVPTQTLLGIRFWDPAGSGADPDDLSVTAQLLSADRTRRVGRAIPARRTRGGVYAFFGLLPAAEMAAADQVLWDVIPPERRVVVDVHDPLNRYVPLSFQVAAPHRRPFQGEGAWLARPLALPAPAAGQAQGVALWSGPARAIPAGLTALYGNVVLGDAERDPPPAAYAIVEVLRPQNGRLVAHAYGMTDAAGRLSLPMAYPRTPEPANNAPYPRLGAQTFALTVRVYCQPAALQPLPGSTTPNLEAILGQAQAQVALQYDPDQAPALTLAAQQEITLQFGLPLVLRTARPNGEPPEPFLRIQAA